MPRGGAARLRTLLGEPYGAEKRGDDGDRADIGQLYALGSGLQELALPATFFATPHKGKVLPGLFLRNANANAPVVLVIGGADTCFEDLFLTVGRSIFERG